MDALTADARNALDRAAAVLRPYADDDQIAALISKMTIVREARSPLADALDDVAKAVQGSPGSAQLAKAQRDLQLEYLYAMSPTAAAAWERNHEPQSAGGPQPVQKVEGVQKLGGSASASRDSASNQLVDAADRLQKADPRLTRFQAMSQAARENPELAASVAGGRDPSTL